MKYLLTILLFACGLQLSAQVYQEDTTKYMKNLNAYPSQLPGFWATKIMRIPDTTNNHPQQGVPGAIGRNPLGTRLFTWDGTQWVAGSGGVQIDSVFITSIDSIFITNTDSIFIISGNDTIYIGNSDQIRDTAKLTAGYGLIIVSPSTNDSVGFYGPNYDDRTVILDTSVLDDFISYVINNDTTIINNNDSVPAIIVDTLSNSPPAGATSGYKVLIGTSPTGLFAGHANDIAELVGAVWTFTDPVCNQQVIVDNAITYATYQYNCPANIWKQTSVLWRVGGNRGVGSNAFIGRPDKQRFIIKSWGKTGIIVDTTRDVLLPKYTGLEAQPLFFKPGANGKIDTGRLKIPSYETPVNMDSVLYVDNGEFKYGTATGGGGGGTTTNALTFNNSGTGDASGTTFDGSAARTLSYNSIGAVPTTRTVNGKALSSDITLGLASSDFANQGTTTTVLHGNASGNPSFSAVDLANDITGTLASANGGTGFSTYTKGDIIYSSATNTLSKLGIGTTGQPLIVSSSGVPSWGTYISQDSVIISRSNLGNYNIPIPGDGRAYIGLRLENPTAATVGTTIQNSPVQQFTGTALNTTNNTSLPVTFFWYLIPATGAYGASPSTGANGNLVLRSTSSGANLVNISQTGAFTTAGAIVAATGNISSSGGGIIGQFGQITSAFGVGQINTSSSATAQTYRTSNGGSNLTPSFASGNTSTNGTPFTITDPANSTPLGFGLLNDAATKTRIQTARFGLTNTTFTAGSESADLSIYTGLSGGTERVRFGFNGVTTFFKPIAFSGSTPSYTLGTGAGTGATASITGNDAAGYITINSGTTPTATGDILTFTFNTALTNTPTSIQITAGNTTAAQIFQRFYIDQATASTTSFVLKNTSTAISASSTYILYYHVTQ